MPETMDFLSIPQAAQRLGITRIAVFKKVKSGRIMAIRVGRSWAIPAAAVAAHISGDKRAETSVKDAFLAPVPVRPKTPQKQLPPKTESKPKEQPSSLDDLGWD